MRLGPESCGLLQARAFLGELQRAYPGGVRAFECRHGRESFARRIVSAFAFWRRHKVARCGDFPFEDPPDVSVREPRRPRPSSPGGAIMLELPPQAGWNL
jgi:hypothetical protein